MIALLKTWLSSNILRLFGYGAAALSVFSVLLGARQSGRKVEQLNQLKKKIGDQRCPTSRYAYCSPQSH